MLNYEVNENTVVQGGVVFPPLSNRRSFVDSHIKMDEIYNQIFNTKSRLGIKFGVKYGEKTGGILELNLIGRTKIGATNQIRN